MICICRLRLKLTSMDSESVSLPPSPPSGDSLPHTAPFGDDLADGQAAGPCDVSCDDTLPEDAPCSDDAELPAPKRLRAVEKVSETDDAV